MIIRLSDKREPPTTTCFLHKAIDLVIRLLNNTVSTAILAEGYDTPERFSIHFYHGKEWRERLPNSRSAWASARSARQPSPWSLTAGFGERLKDTLMSLIPGR